MNIKQCPNCQKQFYQDKRVSKQLPCGCISCMKCYKTVFQLTKEIKCKIHQKVYSINPEELQDYVVQEQIQQQVLQPQEQFVDQLQINECFRQLQGQQVQKQNYYLMLREVTQDSVQFMKHIQALSTKAIIKTLIDQFFMSRVKIKKLLKRLSELQVINEVQQKQALRVGQQDPHLSQNNQDQLQQQFQQILQEIDELKKNQDQWMDVQSLRVNVQRCMFGVFVYLSENSKSRLLTDKEAEYLLQKYFKQFKVLRSLSQVSNSVVQQKSQFQSQNNEQQNIQESQNIEQQQQNQTIDQQQRQDIVQVKQFLVYQEIFQQEKQIFGARLMFQQMEQNLLNLQNDFSFINQIDQSIQEQTMSIVPISPVIITFDNLVQFLSQIKEDNVSLQTLKYGPLNKLGLINQVQILYQLSKVTEQQICLKLSQIIQFCKSQQEVSQVAANVSTLLNYMNFAFTNQNFQNLDLTNSDLSDTTFTNCKFNNSNLYQANLRNSKFVKCDFTSSNLTSIITEHPHIFIGHTSSIYAVAISSDSKFIVSGSRDKTVRLWDVKTGTCKTMVGHTKSVYAVAISGDSQFVVSGSDDNTVRLWDVKTDISQTMSGHTS